MHFISRRLKRPIVCNTIEEKEELIREYEDEKKEWEKNINEFWEPEDHFNHPITPEILTVDELREINKTKEYYSELLPWYYVKADGSDSNNGTSKETAFKTLSKVVSEAKQGRIKYIKVVGTLNDESEQGNNYESVFVIDNTGKEEITISGDFMRGVLSAKNNKRVLCISGNSHIHLKNIEITGGHARKGGGLYIHGGGLYRHIEDIIEKNQPLL